MNPFDISSFRLRNQQIAGTKFRTVKDLVGWMGAMQAQDYAMAKWAVGARLPGSTDKTIEESFNKGEILRTHLLRPTWHFVSSNDIYWLLELTAPHIKASLKSRHKDLGLNNDIFDKSGKTIEEALTSGKHLTREEIIKALKKAKIQLEAQQGYVHLILSAELTGIICSGEMRGREQTYALLAERVLKKEKLNRDEALTRLAVKYFTSHGPATVQDFVWWSGLPVRDAKKALEMAASNLISETIGEQTYWFSKMAISSVAGDKSVYLLPAYDEFLISYRERSHSLSSEKQARAISSNGIFRPVIVLDGQTIGLWKRLTKKERVIVGIHLFQPPSKNLKGLIEKAAAVYGEYLDRKTEIVWGNG